MPVPTTLSDLSTTASSNYPAGTDSPATLDDVQRAHGAFIAQLRDDPTANSSVVIAIAKGGTGASTAAAARTALGAAASGALASSGITGAAASGANSDITSLTALTAGGLPDNSVLTADIANAAITAAKMSGAQTGSAPVYGCRAWCRFDGTLTGTNAPLAGGNVTSVTRNSIGNYTINFTTAMPDANFCVQAAVNNVSGGSSLTVAYVVPPTVAGSCQVITLQNNGANPADTATHISIFR